jgi:hypothetical protein
MPNPSLWGRRQDFLQKQLTIWKTLNFMITTFIALSSSLAWERRYLCLELNTLRIEALRICADQGYVLDLDLIGLTSKQGGQAYESIISYPEQDHWRHRAWSDPKPHKRALDTWTHIYFQIALPGLGLAAGQWSAQRSGLQAPFAAAWRQRDYRAASKAAIWSAVPQPVVLFTADADAAFCQAHIPGDGFWSTQNQTQAGQA